MLLAIGMFHFSVPTVVHDELKRRSSWIHATSQRIGARIATQFVGVGAETLSISGVAHAELSDGRASLDELRSMAAAATPGPSLMARGRSTARSWFKGSTRA